jgi:inorganic phosphate transporter, PiT family
MFSWIQVFIAAGFAFSLDSNNIANVLGEFTTILAVLRAGEISPNAAVPSVAMIAFGVALIVGLWFIGKEVIASLGHNLTKMPPTYGFCTLSYGNSFDDDITNWSASVKYTF